MEGDAAGAGGMPLPGANTGGRVATGGGGPVVGTGDVAGDGTKWFDGIPSVGTPVSSPVLDGGAAATPGTVSAASQSNGNTLVTITYPPDWDCPDGVGGGSSAARPTTSATRIPPDAGVAPVVPDAGPTAESAATLGVTDCKGLAALRRPKLKADSQSMLASTRSSLLAAHCRPKTETICIDSTGTSLQRYQCYPGGDAGARAYGAGGASNLSSPTVARSGAADDDSDSNGATEYSTTNTQIATVDEADYVKNDSGTIYVLAADGLHVIDAWPAAETREVAKLVLPGEPRRLFLEQNRLVVYSRMQATTASSAGRGAGSTNPSDQGCTYGYDCRFTSEGGHTLAVVYDVSTPAAPQELVRYEFSGGYVASRRVGSFVYTILHDVGAPQIPGLDYTLPSDSYAAMEQAYAARMAANDELIDKTNDAFFLPWTQMTVAADGTVRASADCGQALVSAGAAGMSFVSLQSFDLTTLTTPTRTVVASNPGYVYASPEALYLAVDNAPEPTDQYGYSGYGRRAADSTIHKFRLQGVETRYIGSSVLPGHILNQFAMDENLGVLRVASTAGWVPSPNVVSYITTIGETAGAFKRIGQLGGIAPDEDIRSVRFDNDRGFVVTFKKTDPLFVFDLSTPAEPKMLGELKIPGFSTYMHRLDANHLLAIGYDADDQGSYAYFNGIQIQIFDVTDLANPSLLWKKVIGTRGSNSEALTNHLAFNYFAPKKMLALPITICEGGGNGTFGDKLTFAGLMAFDVSLETGITEHGRLPFLDVATVSSTSNCNQWWTSASSLVKRSIFMDDWIYALSDEQLRVASLADMAQVLKTVPLGTP